MYNLGQKIFTQRALSLRQERKGMFSVFCIQSLRLCVKLNTNEYQFVPGSISLPELKAEPGINEILLFFKGITELNICNNAVIS